MSSTSFLSREEITEIGLKSYGSNILISRKASIYGASHITIGDNVRIDDYCILSGHITLGSNIHISAYVALYGSKEIEMMDFSGISPHSTIYSAMDDFSGEFLIGPVHPENATNVTGGKVTIERFVQIGCNSVVFPNVTIEEGSVVGAMSLVKKSLEKWGIYAGVPLRKIKDRKKVLIKYIY